MPPQSRFPAAAAMARRGPRRRIGAGDRCRATPVEGPDGEASSGMSATYHTTPTGGRRASRTAACFCLTEELLARIGSTGAMTEARQCAATSSSSTASSPRTGGARPSRSPGHNVVGEALRLDERDVVGIADRPSASTPRRSRSHPESTCASLRAARQDRRERGGCCADGAAR
jgi:hypothetical protein